MPTAAALGGLGLWAGDVQFHDPDAQWLWAYPYDIRSYSPPADTLVTMYNNFTMPANSTPAVLYVAVDDSTDVYLNGIFIGTKVGSWNPFFYSDWPNQDWPVTLQGGPNTLAFRCANIWGGAAGLLVSLTVHNATTGQDDVLLRSDGSGTWKYTTTQAYNPPM